MEALCICVGRSKLARCFLPGPRACDAPLGRWSGSGALLALFLWCAQLFSLAPIFQGEHTAVVLEARLIRQAPACNNSMQKVILGTGHGWWHGVHQASQAVLVGTCPPPPGPGYNTTTASCMPGRPQVCGGGCTMSFRVCRSCLRRPNSLSSCCKWHFGLVYNLNRQVRPQRITLAE